ncbi:MAG TPA: tetratricopeptide repeat protein, partial [Candidatus Cybelea sp.]|nr:tetratricopeptide repeat protein [Candidatus Cybelea sp.]
AVPSRPTDFWYVPESFPRTGAGRSESSAEKFARAVRFVEASDFAAALPLLTTTDLSGTPLSAYALYYRALALAGLNRVGEATELLDRIEQSSSGQRGYLFDEAIPIKRADFDVARFAPRNAVDALEGLSKEKFLTSPEDVWLKLGRAAEAAGDRGKAIDAYRKVYFESPLSLQALDAQTFLNRLDESTVSDRFKLELARAERIFNARRWAQARAGFAPLASLASGDDKELIALRIAECDYYLDRFRASRDALTPFIENASRKAEARFFYLTATRALGDHAAYVLEARALVDEFPDSSWALETLNNLATHYVVVDDDATADTVFRELVRRFPDSRYAERAYWKVGWWAYRNGSFADAAQA